MKKYVYVCLLLTVFIVAFTSCGSTNDPRAQFEIAPPLQTHPAMEMVHMWLVGIFPEGNPEAMYFRVENLSDYPIHLCHDRILEVYHSGHWRTVDPNPGLRQGHFLGDGPLPLCPYGITPIRIPKADHDLMPGLYRLRATIIRLDTFCESHPHPSFTPPPGDIHHDIVTEFYLE